MKAASRGRRSSPAPARLHGTLPFVAEFHSLRDRFCPTDHCWPLHVHDDYEVMNIVEGRYSCLLNGVQVTVPPGGLLLVKPGDRHQDTTANPLRFRALLLRIKGVGSQGRSLPVLDHAIRPAEQALSRQPADLPGLLDSIAAECARNDRFSTTMVDSLCLRYLCRLLREFPDRAKIRELRETSEDAIFARDILACMSVDLGASVRISAYAKTLGVSSRTLTLRTRRLFKTSPAKLFLGLRLSRAQELLLRSDLPIKEISRQLGFASQFHFSNTYRRWAGHPPSAERQEPQTGDEPIPEMRR